MAKVFLSYHRASKTLIDSLVRDLSDIEVEAWYDQCLAGGQQWWDGILAEIRKCDVILAALTPGYFESPACEKELSYAASLNKLVLPLRLSKDVTATALPPLLRERQWVDYFDRDVDAFTKLVRTLNRTPAAQPLPDPLPAPPAAPISTLDRLREQIVGRTPLGSQEQSLIIVQLAQQLRDGEAPDAVSDLAHKLKKREDFLAKVIPEIEQLFREIDGDCAKVLIQRRADPEDLDAKRSYASAQGPLPGHDAAPFMALVPSAADEILVRPSAYPLTPMYLLDEAFRIIDWNHAFSVAFDRTMEGRKGVGVVEWTYFLDNYEDVLAHGQEKFGNTNQLPPIDVEEILYTSMRYGQFTATKRAYQIPDDEGTCIGWLVTLDPHFSEDEMVAFRRDLLAVLARDLMWSEYAVSYDRVLNNTRVYPALIEKFVGGHDDIAVIPQEARIIDLGAGTGNLTHKLITTGPRRLVLAAENNRMMLEILRDKCRKYLRHSPDRGGVIALKQDITSLYGIDDGYFDFAFMNNVLYAIDDVRSCLQEVCRILRPGGELRLSGPRKDTDLQLLFDRIMQDLKDAEKFEQLEADYWQIRRLNELRLSEILYRWTTKEVEELIREAGFSEIVHSSEDAYCGQSMFICARK
jgi:SAM-dependent methyltransferase